MRTAVHRLPAFLLFGLLTSTGWVWAGDIYMWKDAKGVTHYSDVAPEGGATKIIKGGVRQDIAPPARPAAPAPTDTAKQDPTLSDPEAAFRKRRAEAAEAEAKAEKERQEAAARKENCEAARGQLTALKSGQRVARYNAAGEQEILDDAAREAEIARIQGNVDRACK